MDLLTGIESRRSALKLGAPGPTREHIEQMIGAGVCAPDHGRLRPWRFVVLEGAARQKLGDAMAEMLRVKFPQATSEQLAAERNKTMRAPTLIAVAASITKGKIPDIEQIAAVSAAAQNMLLTAHALGYGAMWKTGAAAYDATAKKALGLSPEDHIVAFLYFGTIVMQGPQTPIGRQGLTTWL